MLGVMSTMFITWMTVSTVYWMFSEAVPFKQCATDGGIVFLMVVFGWLPSVVVGIDINERLEKQ